MGKRISSLELIEAIKELAFQNEEKEKRAAELIIANKELAFQNDEKEKRAAELIIANKELAFQNEEKEKRAAELIIANKELAFQNEEKEKRAAELILANKELESFTFIASHDLQEPLRKIQTFAGRVMDEEAHNLSKKGKEHLERMQVSVHRMQTLLKDLLSYMRSSATSVVFERVSLSILVAEVVEELEEDLQAKNAVVEADNLGYATIIPFQFRQLLQNLISNSLKFSKPNQQPHIKILTKTDKGSAFNVEELNPETTYCNISFADNGIGFEPIYSKKIFEIFQRLHGRETYEGTGIGLSIVKKIIDNHKGVIVAEGQPGKGATIQMFIPVL